MVNSSVEFTALMDTANNRILIRPAGLKNAILSEGACLQYVRSMQPGSATAVSFQHITNPNTGSDDEVKWSFSLNFKPDSQTTFFSHSNVVNTDFNLNFDKAHPGYKVPAIYQATVKELFVFFMDTIIGISDKCRTKKEVAEVLKIAFEFLTMPTIVKDPAVDKEPEKEPLATGITQLKDAPGPKNDKWPSEVQDAHACSYSGCGVFHGAKPFDIFPCCVCSFVQHNDEDSYEFDTSSTSKWSCLQCTSVCIVSLSLG